MKKHTIQMDDFAKRVTLYVDGELSSSEEMEFLQEIQQNPGYVRMLSKERNFKEFIKSRIQRKPVSQTLVQSIKDKISATSSSGI